MFEIDGTNSKSATCSATGLHADGAIDVEDHASDTSDEDGDGGFDLDVSSPFADAHAQTGVVEKDSVVYAAGVRIGHVEWIHSTNISLKMVCECESHRAPADTPDARACYVLLNVNRLMMDKYKRALVWLVDQVRCTRDEHLSAATVVRAEFGMRT